MTRGVSKVRTEKHDGFVIFKMVTPTLELHPNYEFLLNRQHLLSSNQGSCYIFLYTLFQYITYYLNIFSLHNSIFSPLQK